MGLSIIGSVFDITAIAINRYCCVCHSVTYHRIYCHWHTPLYLCLVWLLTLLALVPSFFVGFLEYGPRIYSCTFIQTASCLNAIVYGILNQNFCRGYKKITSALWNPWNYLQDSSKGSRAEAPESQAPPVVNIQPAVQADALLRDPRPGDKLLK
ncbi:hypothetical protein E2I00_006845 [Balaenoptera physalus]|uniref:G-protein coupled receptors family 1 profile domain-containing protein n=1 Tax=Balaenoptera physalus TaxID=9770 RepID=A0A643BQR3_BALPH|nr:hypothetical protein E2I00_006845 [Balaenoptera physalus]